MADNYYNIIKPVETLQNITNVTPAKYREKRKKQQNSSDQDQWEHKTDENELKESTEEDINSKIAANDKSEHIIDYRA